MEGGNQPPTVSITNCPDYTLTSSTYTFYWSGSDPDGTVDGYHYDLDDASPDNWTTSTSHTYSNLSNGYHTFYVRAVDNDGDYSTVATCGFTVDVEELETAYLEFRVVGSNWVMDETNVSAYYGTWYIIYSEVSNHPIDDPDWNDCGGNVQVLNPDGFDDSMHFFFSRVFVGDQGFEINSACNTVMVQIEANLESYTGSGGFWTSTDAAGSSVYSFYFNNEDCEERERTIPGDDLYFYSPIEISIGYDDTAWIGDFQSGVKGVRFEFNGWLVSPREMQGEVEDVPCIAVSLDTE